MQTSNIEIQSSEQVTAEVNPVGEEAAATTIRFSELQYAGGGHVGVSW